jgi:hypothetical protein
MRLRTVFILLSALFASAAHAQREGNSAWLNLDYTYNQITYKESKMSEKGDFAGIRGDLGLGLSENFGISVGGEYMDGHMNYDGSTFTGTAVKQVTKDYIRETRILAHMLFGPVVFSAGVAQREWFDDLVVSYRRRTTYDYYPMALTLYRGELYIKAQVDVWKSGKNKSYMHDVNASERDVEFKQPSGSGWGAEVGYMLPTADKIFARVFLAYHQWSVSDSDTQNDGVYNLMEPKNTTTVLQGGLGLSF